MNDPKPVGMIDRLRTAMTTEADLWRIGAPERPNGPFLALHGTTISRELHTDRDIAQAQLNYIILHACAITAIQVMGDPSEAMIDAAGDHGPMTSPFLRERAKKRFQRMMLAALK